MPRAHKPAGLATLRNDFHTNDGRGNGLVALVPRAHKPAGLATLRNDSHTNDGRGNGLVALMRRAHKPAGLATLRNDSHTNDGRGNGLVALVPCSHQAVVAGDPPQSPDLGPTQTAHICAVFATIISMSTLYSHIFARVPRRIRVMLAGLALAVLTVAVFAPVFSARLLLWDDAAFITRNYRIHHLDWQRCADLFRLRPLFGPHAFGLYVPLTELSAAIEYRFAGAEPRVFHITNLALHIIAVLLVWRVLRALRLAPAAAWFGAAIFAIHPLQVESVAWVAERKNVICGVFFFLSLLLHLHWRRSHSVRPYLGCLLAGICALLSKPAAVTLPLALLAFDVWYQRQRFWPAFRAHFPLLAFACAAGLATVYLQHTHGALTHATLRVWIENLGIAARGLWWYMWKFVVPLNLAPVYPRGAVTPRMALWLIGAVALGAVIVWTRRRTPLVSLGLAWYVIISMPTLQLVSAGLNILAADRFFYLPGVGLICAAAWLWQRWQMLSKRHVAYAAAVALLATWALAAHSYTRVWHDDLSLWSYTLRMQPGLLLAQKHHAISLFQAGKTNAAVDTLRQLAQRQHDYRVFTLLAQTEYAHHNMTQALYWANTAVAAAPRAPEPRFMRAAVFSALRRWPDATNDWYTVLSLQPLHPDVHHRLAYDLLDLGDTNGAAAAFQAHLARHHSTSVISSIPTSQ